MDCNREIITSNCDIECEYRRMKNYFVVATVEVSKRVNKADLDEAAVESDEIMFFGCVCVTSSIFIAGFIALYYLVSFYLLLLTNNNNSNNILINFIPHP